MAAHGTPGSSPEAYGGSAQGKDDFGTVKQRAGAAVTRVSERGREAGVRMQEVVRNFKAALDESLEHRPMATLAVVAIVGFALGALWKS